MSEYLIIETGEPSEAGDVKHSFDLAANLVAKGHQVTVFLVQNGVLPARRGAQFDAIADAIKAGVTLLADDFSLRERGIGGDQLNTGIAPAPLESVVDRLAAGCKTLWH